MTDSANAAPPQRGRGILLPRRSTDREDRGASREAAGAVLGQRALRVHRPGGARSRHSAPDLRLRHRAGLYLLIYAFHMPAFAIISGYFSKSDAPGPTADGARHHRHPAAVRDLRSALDADEVDRRGAGQPEPHAAVVDAVVPARPRHLPPRPALPRAAALAAAVDRGDLDRRGLPAQHRLDALAVAHARSSALLRPGLVAARPRRRGATRACCGDRPWWVFVGLGGARWSPRAGRRGSSSTSGAR